MAHNTPGQPQSFSSSPASPAEVAGSSGVSRVDGRGRWWQCLAQDGSLLLTLLAAALVQRIVTLSWFNDSIADASATDIIKVLLVGCRFDMVAVSWVALLLGGISSLTSGLSALSVRRWPWLGRTLQVARRFIGGAIIAVVWIATVCSWSYRSEYHGPYDSRVFHLFYDDAGAIALTVWQSFPVVWLSLLMVLGVSVLIYIWLCKPLPLPRALWWRRVGLSIGIGFMLLASVSFAPSEGVSRRQAAVTTSATLNGMALHPLVALFFAQRDWHLGIGRENYQTFLPLTSPEQALREYMRFAPGSRTVDPAHQPAPGNAFDQWHQRTVTRPASARHVIMVYMESLDAWPFFTEYQALNLVPQLQRLADDGLMITNCLPAGHTTASSFSSFVYGLPSINRFLNHDSGLETPSLYAPARQFSAAGYKTRVIMGNPTAWQHIGAFCRAQGFAEVLGQEHMPAAYHKNMWGVDDEYLWEFVAQTLDDSEPSFTLILTTSNHPPFTIDVDHAGFPLQEVPELLREVADAGTQQRLRTAFAHQWYADLHAGTALRMLAQKLPRALIAVTGDHNSRHWFHGTASIPERELVPLILYGPEVIARPVAAARCASHYDIPATLLNWALPHDAVYYATGRDVVSPGGVGWAPGKAITPQALYLFGEGIPIPLPGIEEVDSSVQTSVRLRRQQNCFHGLNWLRVNQPQLLPQQFFDPQ